MPAWLRNLAYAALVIVGAVALSGGLTDPLAWAVALVLALGVWGVYLLFAPAGPR